MVKRQRSEIAASHAGKEGDLIFLELGLEKIVKETAERLRIGSHLDHHTIPGGERAGQRAQRQEQRIVPRRNNTDHAFGLRDEAVLASGEGDSYVTFLRAHPLRHTLTRVANAVDRIEDLEHLRFLGRPVTEVLADRIGDRVGVGHEDLLDLVQRGFAILEAGIGVAEIRRALQLINALRLVLDVLNQSKLGCLSHKDPPLRTRRPAACRPPI